MIEEYLPNALLYGVPYELFWHLNPRKLEPFKMSYQKRLEIDNHNAWIQGQYIRLAIGSVLDGKKCKYPEAPLFAGEDEKSSEEKFLAWIEVYNANFDRNTAD